MKEHRKGKRVPLDVYLNKFVRGVPFMVRARDISPEGIYLTQLLEPQTEEERVGVQFQLPGSREIIYAEGKVVRDEEAGGAAGNGVHFTLITDHHRKLIRKYIARRAA